MSRPSSSPVAPYRGGAGSGAPPCRAPEQLRGTGSSRRPAEPDPGSQWALPAMGAWSQMPGWLDHTEAPPPGLPRTECCLPPAPRPPGLPSHPAPPHPCGFPRSVPPPTRGPQLPHENPLPASWAQAGEKELEVGWRRPIPPPPRRPRPTEQARMATATEGHQVQPSMAGRPVGRHTLGGGGGWCLPFSRWGRRGLTSKPRLEANPGRRGSGSRPAPETHAGAWVTASLPRAQRPWCPASVGLHAPHTLSHTHSPWGGGFSVPELSLGLAECVRT